jgi:hypothetical protein
VPRLGLVQGGHGVALAREAPGWPLTGAQPDPGPHCPETNPVQAKRDGAEPDLETTMTLRTTSRAAIAALALTAMTLAGAAVTPAAAGGKHFHGHGFHHGFHGQHFGFHFSPYYPSFYNDGHFQDCWIHKKVFIPHVGFVVKKLYIC